MSGELCGCFLICDACEAVGRVRFDPPDEEPVSYPCSVCGGNGIVACTERAVDRRPDGTLVCAAHLRWTLP